MRSEEFRREVEDVLSHFLTQQRHEFEKLHPSAAKLVDIVTDFVRRGGKRVRPYFCLLGYGVSGKTYDDKVLAVASSLELLHTFAIIHDDIMDSATTRRGGPSLHIALRGGDEADERRRGTSLALLAGDLCLVFSETLFEQSGFEGILLEGAREHLRAMQHSLAAGQFLDIARDDKHVLASSAEIALLKTAAYTVQRPLLIGATLAGLPPADLESMSQYGIRIGEAFQLRDDLDGIFGDPAVTGKDAADIQEGKLTSIIERAMNVAAPGEAATLRATMGRANVSADEIETVKRILTESGAARAAEQRIQELVGEAKKSLESHWPGDQTNDALVRLNEVADTIGMIKAERKV